MNQISMYSLLLWGLFYLSGCTTYLNNSLLFTPLDVVEEGLFTSGIEGPSYHENGNIYLVNFQKEGTIGVLFPDHKVKEWVMLPNGSIGNGIRVHSDGDLLVADYMGHNVLKINVINKKIQVLAHEREMNQPNDLAFHPAGFIYASDPDWKKSSGQLWLIRSDGTTFCLEKNMGTTNGIEVSPNGKYLYVNESVQRKIWRYNLDKQGFVSNKRLFYQFDDFGLDGMRCDIKGNLYVTRHGKGTVVCLNQKGKRVTEIQLKGTKPSNITFGGKDGKTAYITLQDRGLLESFLVPFAGQDWFRFQKK
jgi:sugar lactone lactonase YvrE